MIDIKKLRVFLIEFKAAKKIYELYHYSGRGSFNEESFGIEYNGKLLGAISYGSSSPRDSILKNFNNNVKWENIKELNRIALSDVLPKNAESRCVAYTIRWMKKNIPNVKYILSFADATRSGHGTIYQACNFKLTDIRKNSSIFDLRNGEYVNNINISLSRNSKYGDLMRRSGITNRIEFLNKFYPGWKKLDGYILRYIYFMNPEDVSNFTGEIIPYSKIQELGLEMYRGKWLNPRE